MKWTLESIQYVDVSHEADEVTFHENYLKQILQTKFFHQKYIHLDENSFILCSLMTVFNIHVKKNCLTESNKEVTQK